MQNQFQKEQDEVLKAILKPIYKMWETPVDKQRDFLDSIQPGVKEFILELYVTASCNQKCTYCYLTQHGDELYPKEIRSKETILKNLEIYLNFSLKNNYCYNRVDIFSGEIWHTPFGHEVLEKILAAVKAGLKINTIVIPTNFSFCEKKETMEIMEKYQRRFRDQGVKLHFSCSMDGLIIDKIKLPVS